MEYAVINDNKVVSILEIPEENLALIQGRNQAVIELESFPRTPKVGWIYDRGECYPDIAPVTPRQIRQAWILLGKSLTEIEIAIDSLPEPQRSLARAEWEYSTLVFRRNKLVIMLGQINEYSEEELDYLWIFAGTL